MKQAFVLGNRKGMKILNSHLVLMFCLFGFSQIFGSVAITAQIAKHNILDGSIIIRKNGSYLISGRAGDTTSNHIMVERGVTADITLENVNINTKMTDDEAVDCAFEIRYDAKVTLTLNDSNCLISGNFASGLQVYPGATVEISGDGSLVAVGDSCKPGIGGDDSKVVINSGIITATGGTSDSEVISAPGIGGERSIIVINSGTVSATGAGGDFSPGIGGRNSTVEISGGNVKGTVSGQPKDSNGKDVFCLKISFDPELGRHIPFTDIFIEKNGTSTKYSVKDVLIQDDGKFYFWLPADNYGLLAMQIDNNYYIINNIRVENGATCTLNNYLEGNSDYIDEHGNEGDFGSNLTWKFSDGVLTVSGSGNIPEGIEQPWYNFGTSIQKVVIKEGVTGIGNQNFINHINLDSVILPQSLTYINDNAFENCYNLKSVVIPSDVTHIGGMAFGSCFNLTSVTNLSPNPQPIGNSPFTDVKKITLFVPAEYAEKYKVAEGWKEFGVINVLVKSISLNKTAIDLTMGSTEQLTLITVPEEARNQKATWISTNPAVADVSPTGLVTAKSRGQTTISATMEGLTADCRVEVHNNDATLKSLSILDQELTPPFNSNTFDYTVTSENFIQNVKIIAVPNDPVASVKGDGLHSLSGEDTTFIIGVTAEDRISKLNYRVKVVNKPSFGKCGDNDGNATWKFSDSVLTIRGTGAMGDWDDDHLTPWYSYRSLVKKTVIEDGITHIGNYAFSDCFIMDSITLPQSVTSIGESAFSNCNSLLSITIPENVSSIENNTFYECKSLRYIVIPESVQSIKAKAFGYQSDTGSKISRTVINHSLIPQRISDTVFANDLLDNHILYVPRAAFESYRSSDVWKDFRKIEILKSNDATLKSITVPDQELLPAFHADSLNYTVIIENHILSIVINAEAGDTMSIVEGTGKKDNLRVGGNDFIIKVTSEDGMKREYKITVTRRSVTGILPVTLSAQVYLNNGILHVDSPAAERIAIYSVAGELLYRLEKQAGKISFPFNRHNTQVLIVKGSSGWVKKLIIGR
jgi:hypothetical protein